MSTENQTLYELLDSSCEDMLLYFQEVVYHLSMDVENLSKSLEPLFTEVGLTAADEHQEGREVSAEVKDKLKLWKKLAEQTEDYAQFRQKYGSRAVKALLGVSGKFSGNPTGIGADDYPDVIRQVYEGDSTLQRDLKAKYPGVSAVVEYMTSNHVSIDDFTSTSAEVLNLRCDFHLEQPALLDKFSSFLTEKDKESPCYNVMEYQFSLVFNQFSAIFGSTGSIVERKLTPERDVVTSLEDACRRLERLVAQKKMEIENIQDPKRYKIVMSELERTLAVLIVESKKFLEEIDAPGSEKSLKVRNEKALRLAILEGAKSFKKLVGNDEYRTMKVADIIGRDPAKMTVLERLAAVDSIEDLKREHVGKVVHESITAMQKIKENPKSEQHFNAASKGIAILEGNDTYQCHSSDRPNTDDSISIIPKEDGADCLEKRLERFHFHYEENKKFLSNKPTKTLAEVIENIMFFFVNSFGKKLNQPKSPEIAKSDNLQQNQSSSPQLRKRGLSEPKISDSPSVGMFKLDLIIETDILKVNDIPRHPAKS